jgi:hypothetical protein
VSPEEQFQNRAEDVSFTHESPAPAASSIVAERRRGSPRLRPKPHCLLAEAQEGLQRREDVRDSIRPDVALGVLYFDKEDMLCGDALGLDIADPTDDPAQASSYLSRVPGAQRSSTLP